MSDKPEFMGLLDLGVNRTHRIRLCAKRAWCVENEGHAGPCIEVPREKYKAPSFGPRDKR